jgi:hypothetical protein
VGAFYSAANGVKGSSTTDGLYDVQGSPKAPKGGCIFDTDKTLFTHSPSPLPLCLQAACKDSDGNTAPALSSIPTTEGAAKGDDDVTTLVCLLFSRSLSVTPISLVCYGVFDSQPTDNMGLARLAHSLLEVPVEHPEASELLSIAPSGSSQITQKCSPDTIPIMMALTCSPSPNTLQAATLPTTLGHLDNRSCFATASTVEIGPRGPDTPFDNAALSVTHSVTYSEPRSSVGETTLETSSAYPVDITSFSSAVAQLVSREISLSENFRSSYDPKTPQSVPSPKLCPPLTPVPSVDTAARCSSPSLPGRNSGSSICLTTPPSSPRTESSVINVEDRAGDGEAVCVGNFTEISDCLARAMSSPTIYGDEAALSPSPPYRLATNNKRRCDDSDDVCHQKRSCVRI